MTVNMGTLDRTIRIVLAVLFALLIVTGAVQGVAATILGILAVVFVLTSIIRFCPMYVPFHINTDKKKT